MTLIEVLAALALLAAVLMGILTARSRATLQWNRANERIRATEAADRLLSSWWQAPATLPRSGEGTVPDDARLHWRTRPVADPAAEALYGQIVRLEVSRAADPASDPTAARVDIVLPAGDTPNP